jgi:outer membrane scaffolding protein for murein synthesis (MipA/OmpV family)
MKKITLLALFLLMSVLVRAQDCEAEAGTLTADASPVTLVGTEVAISATPVGNLVAPADYDITYVLTTGPTFVIEQIQAAEALGDVASFNVDSSGIYNIHTLVAETSDATDPNYLDLSFLDLGINSAGDVLLQYIVQGVCADLDLVGVPVEVVDCTADAGTITADASTVTLVGDTAAISATPNNDSVVPTDYDVTYVLTSGSTLIIQDAGATPSFEVSEAGEYTIHTLVAETSDNTSANFLDLGVIVFGTTTGGDVLGLVSDGGLCASLDVTGAPVSVVDCTADAGTLTADASSVFLVGDTVAISATPNNDSVVPTDYDVTYVLTSGPTLIIQDAGATPSFEISEAGEYTIHTLVAETSDNTSANFLDLGVIVFGTTTGGDVLGLVSDGGLCASLDVTGAPVSVVDCTADAGTLTADATPVTLVGDSVTISATPNGDISVPTDYDVTYVLTSGPTLIIQGAGATPSFEVSEAGDYTIHTLVAETSDATNPNYLDLGVIVPGTTTGGDVLGIVSANGLCASLDVTGAAVSVLDCTADAGTLTADAGSVFLVGDTVTISATPNNDSVVPTDYDVTYVLTSGPTLIIQSAGATPSFEVSEAGDYTIHTLVAETSDDTSANFLDLGVIVFGTTTGGDVLGLVADGGLCASLDVTGAAVTVEDCIADAGTLTADASSVFLVGDTVAISATQGIAPIAPPNLDVRYVLTTGPTLIITQLALTPEFTVTAPGDYTIHTLVAEVSDPSDPNYLDLGAVVIGTTTGGDVLGLVADGGLCASLDVTGAAVSVEDCAADAGTLTADASPVSLVSGVATISATPNGDISVPTGYLSLYVLTSGADLVIEQTNSTASFDVAEPGVYTIHTLVYDANTLDLSVVVIGQTTGGDVLGIITSNGLCASLDVTGAEVIVDEELSIEDNAKQPALSYFPNPVKNTLTLNAQNSIENVMMYNMLGQEVMKVNPNAIESTIDMSSLQTGFYFVKVTISNVTQTIRVIKK